MSSLSIAVAGILTVVGASIYAMFILKTNTDKNRKNPGMESNVKLSVPGFSIPEIL